MSYFVPLFDASRLPGRLPLFALLSAVSLSWAATFPLVKFAVAEIPPATLVLMRLIVGLLTLLVWLSLSRSRPLTGHLPWRHYILIALFGQALPFLLIAWAAAVTPVSETAILVATTPLFAAVFTFVQERQWPGVAALVSLCLGFTGTFGFIALPAPTPATDHPIARLALIAAAVSYASAGRFVAKTPDAHSVRATFVVLSCAAAMMLPMSLFAERPWTALPSGHAIGATLLLGTLSTAAAYVAYYRLIRSSGPAFASLHHFLVPLLALFLGATLLGESFSGGQVFFGLLTVAGLAISSSLIRRQS